MTHKVDYADLYFQYSRSEGWSLEEGIVKSGSFSIDQGVGVRVLSGEKTAFAYSDDISLTALQRCGAGDASDRTSGHWWKHAGCASATAATISTFAQDPLASLDDADKVSAA